MAWAALLNAHGQALAHSFRAEQGSAIENGDPDSSLIADQAADVPGEALTPVRVSVVPSFRKVAPGSQLLVAVIFDHAPGWHVQANKSRDPDALTTTIVVEPPPDAGILPYTDYIQWPPVHLGKFGGGIIESEVFEGTAIAIIPVVVSNAAKPGATQLTVKVNYQACDERICIAPQNQTFTVPIEIVPPDQAQGGASIDKSIFGSFPPQKWNDIYSGRPADAPVTFDLFGLGFEVNAARTIGLILLLVLAALGGLLLNFTPCVLPVIPIKIMSLSMSAGNRARTLWLGAVVCLGIIGFWLAMGCAIAFISGFTAISHLFQYPVFSIIIGVIIAIMAVGMCSVFSLRLPQFVATLSPRHDSVLGSFGFGIMVAVLSTPCTAPFMGAAAAWAATQSPAVALSTFAAIGAGMALPYFVLAAFPQLVKKMPRTGPASELIKQVMGLLMLAAGAYFIGVGLSALLTEPPAPPNRLYWWIVAAFGVMAGLWLAWRTFRISTRAGRRITFGGLGLLIAVISAGIGIRLTDKGPIDWVYYTPQRFADSTDAGNVVVMEFTAEWCLNCKALEQSVLRDPRVVQLFRRDGVVPIKVDITGNNQAGTDMLRRVDRLTIPLLVVFAPDGREVFKGDYYTPQQVIDAVQQAATPQVAAGPVAAK